MTIKKALVCGAGGFIGGHLVKRLKREGFWVRGVDLKFNGLAEMVTDIAQKPLGIDNIPGPLGVRGRNSDNRLIREQLRWAPEQSLRQGMEITYAWIADQVTRQHNKRSA